VTGLVSRMRFRLLQRRLALPKVLAAFADVYPEARFVEVGANDGDQHDHIRPFIESRSWTGVMVEPVPYIFERLRKNYASAPRVALENSAVGAHDGTQPFFHLRDAAADERADLPDWYDGVGSFSRAAVLQHRDQIPDVEERIVESDVAVLGFASLCARHGLAQVDLIVVDTEGHDWEIIRTIDLSVHRPRLLIYEHFHLTAQTRASCRRHLESAGFETMEEGFDTLALQTEADDSLTRRWRALEPAVAGVYAPGKES
jgi:FkbM family methyltransferase